MLSALGFGVPPHSAPLWSTRGIRAGQNGAERGPHDERGCARKDVGQLCPKPQTRCASTRGSSFPAWLQLLRSNGKQFAGGLVFKARRLCVSLNSRPRVIQKKKEAANGAERGRHDERGCARKYVGLNMAERGRNGAREREREDKREKEGGGGEREREGEQARKRE